MTRGEGRPGETREVRRAFGGVGEDGGKVALRRGLGGYGVGNPGPVVVESPESECPREAEPGDDEPKDAGEPSSVGGKERTEGEGREEEQGLGARGEHKAADQTRTDPLPREREPD